MAEKLPAEDEYFARLDKEQAAKLKQIIEAEKAAAAREERRKLHHMRCGKCGGELITKPFRGVDVDLCGECGAVLLDPGELEALAGADQTGVLDGLRNLFGYRGKLS